MSISELSAFSGMSRQWINKLVNKGLVPGVRRKGTEKRDRLEIIDEVSAQKWAARMWKKRGMRRRRRPHSWRIDFRKERLPDSVAARKQIQATLRDTATKIARPGKTVGEVFERAREQIEPELNRLAGMALLPTIVQLCSWAQRGRSPKSFNARLRAGFWIITPGSYEYRSYAGIAREHGITRAALSSAIKQAPKVVRELAANRSGRFRKPGLSAL